MQQNNNTEIYTNGDMLDWEFQDLLFIEFNINFDAQEPKGDVE